MKRSERFRHLLVFEGVPAAKKVAAKGAIDVNEVVDGQCALHVASRFGKADAMAYLMSLGAQPNPRRVDGDSTHGFGTEHGMTPLMFVVACGAPADDVCAGIELLLNAGADVDAQDEAGKTALFHAIAYPLRVERLLDAGADPTITDVRGLNALADAETYRHTESAALLRRRGSAPIGAENGALLSAAEADDLAAVTRLLDAGANPNFRDDRSVLSTAAAEGSLDIVKLLVARGADVNLRESDAPDGDWTALGRAASGGHADVVTFLLQSGADPNIGPMGIVPLEHALESKTNARGDDVTRFDDVVAILTKALTDENGVVRLPKRRGGKRRRT